MREQNENGRDSRVNSPQPGEPRHAEEKTPRPSRPYVPGPLISEPDQAIKVQVPLPPSLEDV